MIVRKKNLKYFVYTLFFLIIALVFQQVVTSMAEQGISSGGPYDNAAAYPQAVSIIIGALLLLQILLTAFKSNHEDYSDQIIEFAVLIRPLALLVIFFIYLCLLGFIGYHLTTTPMIFCIMVVCGMGFSFRTLLISFGVSLLFAYLFEVFLKVVLPGGIFRLNIPW